MSPKERIIEMLAQNLPAASIALSVGVSESYISQLSSDEDVQTRIATARAKHGSALSEDDISYDVRLDDAEESALQRIESSMKYATFGQALAAFKILNAARRRKDVLGGNLQPVSVNVTLSMPAQVLNMPHIQVNANNEIVQVDDRTLVSASAGTVDGLLAARAADNMLPDRSLQRAADRLDNLYVSRTQVPSHVKAAEQTARAEQQVRNSRQLTVFDL